MSKTKLTLYTLSTCKKCQSLKEVLTNESIHFDEVLCDEDRNGVKCDNIEFEVDCNFYPMAVITKKIEKDKGGYFVYVDELLVIHFCTKYDDLMVRRRIKSEYYAICVHNTADMLDLIKKNK